tara:strand:+ start:1509 stop:2210 length:702 start_codon:yes stop_codon:yes gene_type:complete
MIFGFGFSVLNVGNKIQISISENTKAGDRIKRESEQEYVQNIHGDFGLSFHPTHDFIINSNTNYFILGGGIRIRYGWEEASKFQDEHKEIYMNLLKESQEGLSIPFDDAKYIHGPGYIEHQVFHANRAKKWLPSPLQYEPYCTTAEVEALVDDTFLLCPMQHEFGWKLEHIDVERGETIESNKQGQEMYIVFGMRCTVGDKQINQFEVKKQTSTQLQITNASYNLGTLVRIYK